MAQVQKKDSSTQDFDREKIVNALLNAGVSEEEADDVAFQIEGWLEEDQREIVPSSEIKDKVVSILKETNPEAAESFSNYKKGV